MSIRRIAAAPLRALSMLPAEHKRRDIVVIGASAGGVRALRNLAAALPAEFPAAVLIVLHVGASKSILPELLASAGPNTAAHAHDGEALRYGHLMVAPPDHHLLLDQGNARLTRGPKENFARPAIDVLFRSAALEHGPRVIGVVLTGMLDDGTAGLQAIKRCGGVAVVQDPATAEAPSMPASALEYVEIDYCLPIEEIASMLAKLVEMPAPVRISTPSDLLHAHAASLGKENAMGDLKAIAAPSTLVCPECGGGLWEFAATKPPRFQCHTGHAYSLRALAHGMKDKTEECFWAAMRVLQERAVVCRRLATEAQRLNKTEEALDASQRAQADEAQAAHLRTLIDQL